VFAPAVGGAIVACKNITINTVLSLSYGTWAVGDYVPAADRDLSVASAKKKAKALMIFANRGDVIGENGVKLMIKTPLVVKGSGVIKEEMLSLCLTSAEINEACSQPENERNADWEYTVAADGRRLIIGEPTDKKRAALFKTVGLTRVAGGEKSRIYMTYGDKYVRIRESKDSILIKEGIFFDKDGLAKPVVENVVEDESKIWVYLFDSLDDIGDISSATQKLVLRREILPHFSGLEDFST
jgi:hypothetical protein